MALWQIALLGLIVAWLAQSVGVWFQMQHYQKTFSALRSQWSDGRMGAGAAPGRFGKGVIALIVVDPHDIVRRTCLMQGRSVFAQFTDIHAFDGRSVAEVKELLAKPGFDKGVVIAVGKAIEQVEKVAAREGDEAAGAVGTKEVHAAA